MRYGSLFSGIGGFDLGFDRAGMECAWQVEKDEKARAVLTKHWPNVPKYEDVRHVGKQNLAAVDLICGGFPCQDLSVAAFAIQKCHHLQTHTSARRPTWLPHRQPRMSR